MVDVAGRNCAAPRRTHCITMPRLLIGAVSVALLVFIPACGSSSIPAAAPTSITTTSAGTGSGANSATSTTSPVTLPEQNPAEVAACAADAKAIRDALGIYMAEKGAYPSPPAPWSAATYAPNYLPLTARSGGGPFLRSAPATKNYVIEYDSAGHVWIAPPGAYRPYDVGQDFNVDPDVCEAAVG
jgi:hypothetical protein